MSRPVLVALVAALVVMSWPVPVSAQTSCTPGYYSSTGVDPCQPCIDGTFQPNSGATACMFCAPGTAVDHPAATNCTLCAPGTYQSNIGQRVCFTCPEGYIAENSGSSSCTQCPAGSTSDATHTTCISLTTSLKRRSWSQLKQHYR
jgi:hypothetical protein